MKIVDVKNLAIPEVKVITYERFRDERGYFTETFRRSDFELREELAFFKNIQFLQSNESHSQKNVFRGLHFQWNPHMGKLVRTIHGRMIDFALDIRPNSHTFGKIIGHDMPARWENKTNQWIWVPVGFAHGVLFLEETTIEYYCTSEWSPKREASITPLATDINWSLCETNIKKIFENTKHNFIVSEKDKNGFTMSDWKKRPESINFSSSDVYNFDQ